MRTDVTFERGSNTCAKAKTCIIFVSFGFVVYGFNLFVSNDLITRQSLHQLCIKTRICNCRTRLTGTTCMEEPNSSSGFLVRKFKRLLKKNQTSAVTCMKLLNEGRYAKYDDWRPNGCKLHIYKPEDVQSCIRRASNETARPFIVFMGDSRIRQLYYEFIGFIKLVDDVRPAVHLSQHYEDANHDIAVEYKWCPYLHTMMADLIHWNSLPLHSTLRPSIIIISSGSWSIATSSNKGAALTRYTADLTSIRPLLDRMSETTLVLWSMLEDVNEALFHRVTQWRSTNAQYALWNAAANNVLGSSTVLIWSTAPNISHRFMNESGDGIHMPFRANYWHCQLMYNMFCNDHMEHNDATCCQYSTKKFFSLW